jgi:hypothetical protein
VCLWSARAAAAPYPGADDLRADYWQWFTHHRNHGLLPEELRGCPSQLDLTHHLRLDVFSRNIYCDPTQYWFGGLAEEVLDGVEVEVRRATEGRDLVTEKTYHTRAGPLTERLRFCPLWDASATISIIGVPESFRWQSAKTKRSEKSQQPGVTIDRDGTGIRLSS